MKSTDRIRDAYNEWAGIYDTNQNATRDLNARTLREQAFSLAGKRILEIGCGTGINTRYLAAEAEYVTGMDFSEEMLARAQDRVRDINVKFVAGDITRPWPFEPNSFDFISANLVLEHVEDLAFIFDEVFKMLNRGGQCYISELHPFRQLQKSQAKYISQETGKEILVDAFFHSVSELINEGLESGLTLRRVGEHKTETDDFPRLLSILFEKVN